MRDDVQHALREPRLGEHLAPEQPADLRRPFRRLQDDRVAERERRGDRAGREDQRRVPRGDRPDDAHGPPHAHREGSRVGGKNLAQRRVGERRGLAEEAGDEVHLEHPESEGAARLAREHRHDLVLPRFEHLGCLEEDPLARGGRRLRPLGERRCRRLDRPLRIAAAPGGDLGHELVRERVSVLEGAAALGLDEPAADEEPRLDTGLGLGAHRCSSLVCRAARGASTPGSSGLTARVPTDCWRILVRMPVRQSVPFVKTLV